MTYLLFCPALKSTLPSRAGTALCWQMALKEMLKSTLPSRAGTKVGKVGKVDNVLKSTLPSRAGTRVRVPTRIHAA